MRIDPEGVYLELTQSALIYNHESGNERHAPAVTLHFKDGRKWRRVSFFGDDDNGFEQLLTKIGAWLDQHGLDGALAQITDPTTERKPQAA